MYYKRGDLLEDIHIQQIEDLMIYEHDYLVQGKAKTKVFIS